MESTLGDMEFCAGYDSVRAKPRSLSGSDGVPPYHTVPPPCEPGLTYYGILYLPEAGISSEIARHSSKSEGPEVPVNVLRNVYSASHQPQNGIVYDKKPFKLRLEAGKLYSWCLCGRSRDQPLCDGTHHNIFWKISIKPIQFKVSETKDYWLCNCKQTSNRPFCDGTHKRADIQEKKP